MSQSTKAITAIFLTVVLGKYLFSCTGSQALASGLTKPTPAPTVVYEDDALPAAVELYKKVPMAEVAALVFAGLRMPNPVHLVVGNCGAVNAFYFPEARMVGMCTELAIYLTAVEGMSEQQAIDTLTFIFAHELAHAIIEELELPQTSSGEDMADGLALFILTAMDQADVALPAADWFETFDRETGAGDVHSPGYKRAVNVRCYLLGLSSYSGKHTEAKVDGQRARSCKKEFEARYTAWSKLLKPYMN